ncbi:hypothetical protein LTR36_006258 [Oleoguttula mirabilis]|uniref:histidine kinase n=1 Tax=Oleoguttula mirabilis TaxID=1507867 RepID=A0AAV9JC35_9PEZI|nr:hypothetical protein LTR36_006258 [Oleoguttula mirabilis]
MSSESPARPEVTEADHQRTFDRAALLIRQSLDLALGGGVVFLDTSASATDAEDLQLHTPKPAVPDESHGRAMRGRTTASSSHLSPPTDLVNGHASAPQIRKAHSEGSFRERVVLAAASVTEYKQFPVTYGRADSTFKVHITPTELKRMCKKYGRGKLLSIPDYMPTTQYDPEGRSIAAAMSTSFWYLTILRRQFPDAKQVIFVPMFHANLNRWTACLAYTTSPYRVFSYETDYLCTLSFCNAIRMEIVKLATMFADQQKSEFIGSVSHELRSPLHGVLAAIEFMQESECTPFQKSCLDTADACAHTLLDTITMVLDYSKVNSFKPQPTSHASTATSTTDQGRDVKLPNIPGSRTESLLDTNTACDLALITEEVIDGLATGHLSRHRSLVGFDEAEPEGNSSLVDLEVRSGLRRVLCAAKPEVELVLDIQSSADWEFTTQPGAFRNIVMNLFGNSLKYTKRGHVSVSLRLVKDHSAGENMPCMVKLVVQDTGQGMSPDYLRTKIFTPFSQENAKAAGTGLGLSIVRRIVNILQGEIDIKSMLNMGTIATVSLPMKRTTARAPPTTVPSYQRQKDHSVMTLQIMTHRPQVAIYEPILEDDSFGQPQGVIAIHKTLVHYLSEWYNLPAVQTWDISPPAQILICDEINLATLLAQRPTLLDTLSRQILIILCANPLHQAIMTKDILSRQVELLCKPFGPYKLARAICRALEKAAKPDTRTETIRLPDTVSGASIARLPASTSKISQRQTTLIDDTPGTVPIIPFRTPQSLQPRSGVSEAFSNAAQSRVSILTPVKEVGAGPDGGYPFSTPSPVAAPAPAPSPSTTPWPAPLSMSAPSRPTAAHHSSFPMMKTDETTARSQATSSQATSSQATSSQATSSQATSSAGADSATPSVTVQGHKPRLLLVDDNKINLQLLHMFVKRRGYGPDMVQTAEDGLQAVNAFRASSDNGVPPHIIFMDISMPVMDGYEATRRIRRDEEDRQASVRSPEGECAPKQPKRALVVALTGNAGGNDRSEAFESGVDVFMTKPMSMKAVGKVLENWRE